MDRTNRHVGRRRAAALLLSLTVAVPCAGHADPLELTTLVPGETGILVEVLPVQIVFVGYEPGAGPADIDPAQFVSMLPRFGGSVGYWPAIDYDQDGLVSLELMDWIHVFFPELRFADASFEDAFFAFLADIATPAPVTTYQELYNQQPARMETIDQNVDIDAVAVERWLAEHADQLGVDATRPTVFLINWYGRADFRFHVYRHTSAPDPDSGAVFGSADSQALIAWGGTAYNDPIEASGVPFRVWFYDLSAGPDAVTANWDITNPEISGEFATHAATNGITDYRVPPVWEYGNTDGYRPFDSVTLDLALVTRFVAIDELFVGHALYDPWLSNTRTVPRDVQVDHQQIQFPDGADATVLNEDSMVDALTALRRFDSVSVEANPMSASRDLLDLAECMSEHYADEEGSCYGQSTGGWFTNDLAAYMDRHRMRYLEGDADAEILTVTFGLSDALLLGYRGLASSTFTDTPYSAVPTTWYSPRFASSGRGNTAVLTHEVGHHMGMTHPHDGFDLELPVWFGGYDAFQFVWAGDESNSTMSYLWAQSTFGQFDLDAFDRWLAMRYVNRANLLLEDILALPRAPQHFDALQDADLLARQAVSAGWSGQYEASHYFARRAYHEVWSVARALGVPLDQAAGWPSDYRGSFDNAPLIRSTGRASEGREWRSVDFHPTSLEEVTEGKRLLCSVGGCGQSERPR